MSLVCPKEYWVWLSLALGSGARYDRILDVFDDPRELYESGEEGFASLPKVRTDIKERLARTTLGDALRVMELTDKAGGRVVAFDDPEYPEKLRNIYAYPAVLYVKGNLPSENELCIAAVGTRHCSRYGINAAVKITGELVEKGVVTVSGLAEGIDSAVHSASLTVGGKTLAVMATGIDTVYPKQNTELAAKISENGALVTEYPVGTEPSGRNFPVRNRIIAGMASGLIVIEAGMHSGALISANHAIDQGKDVFAVPGNIFRDNLAGNNALLKQGAIPVTCGEDILREYEYGLSEERNITRVKLESYTERASASEKPKVPTAPAVKEKIKQPLPEWADDDSKKIYEALEFKPKYIEEIAKETGIVLSKVLSALTELEILGVAESHPGNSFSAK